MARAGWQHHRARDPAARYRPGRTGAAAGALGRSTEGDHDDMGTHTEWEYQEQVLWVPLPGSEYIEPGEYRPVLSAAGLAYLAANEEEILAWAQAGMTEATEAPGLRRRAQEL